MPDIFAGLVCGYALALLYTPIAAIAIVRARASDAGAEAALPEGPRLVALAAGLHLASFVAFSAIGVALGLMLSGIESNAPAGGLGSPNRAFTLFVLGLVAIGVMPLAAVSQRLRAPLLASGVVLAGVFGWAMPHLAQLG